MYPNSNNSRNIYKLERMLIPERMLMAEASNLKTMYFDNYTSANNTIEDEGCK